MRVTGGTVKLCGMRRVEDVLAAAEAGADLVGLVFAPSKRRIQPTVGRSVVDALSALRRRPLVVGLFVNAGIDEIQEIAEHVSLDAVQLCGDEPPGYEDALTLPVYRVLRLYPGETFSDARARASRYFERARPPRALVIDAHVPGQYGGTGTVADWELAARLAREFPVVLAGGLTPENVARAIETVRPAGVDVSTGIETDGLKDPVKMRAFVAAARAAFAASTGVPASLVTASGPWKEEA